MPKKTKAPGPDVERSRSGKIAPTWDMNVLERAYYRKELRDFLTTDSAVKILHLYPSESLKGPVNVPQVTSDKASAVKNLLRLLEESGLIAGASSATDLFYRDLDDIRSGTFDLFRILTILIGEKHPIENSKRSPPASSMADPQRLSPDEVGSDVLQSCTKNAGLTSAEQQNGHWSPSCDPPGRMGLTGSPLIQRVRISAISDLKRFTGIGMDEDRAQSWLIKVNSAFSRDLISGDDKCWTFADLLERPAKNWYRQLSRTTRNKWGDLIRSFQIRYCEYGVSALWQYHHSHQRSDESPLEYLHRLNVVALHARLKIMDGNTRDRREHVDHFIDTLDDQDLAGQLVLPRLSDVNDLDQVLRGRERVKGRQKRLAFGSTSEQLAQAIKTSTRSDGGRSRVSNTDGGLRRVVFVSTKRDRKATGGGEKSPDPQLRNRSRRSDCGSDKHIDLKCWRQLICQRCGKKGHPSDHCLLVCRGCGDLHEMGECPMEKFYNLIRQWYDPSEARWLATQGGGKYAEIKTLAGYYICPSGSLYILHLCIGGEAIRRANGCDLESSSG